MHIKDGSLALNNTTYGGDSSPSTSSSSSSSEGDSSPSTSSSSDSNSLLSSLEGDSSPSLFMGNFSPNNLLDTTVFETRLSEAEFYRGSVSSLAQCAPPVPSFQEPDPQPSAFKQKEELQAEGILEQQKPGSIINITCISSLTTNLTINVPGKPCEQSVQNPPPYEINQAALDKVAAEQAERDRAATEQATRDRAAAEQAERDRVAEQVRRKLR